MGTSFQSLSCSLYPNQTNRFVLEERIKYTHSVGTPTNASNNCVWETTILILELFFRLTTYNRLKVSYQFWIGMRSRDCPDNVVSIIYICNPIAHCLIQGIFKCLGARAYWHYFRSQQLHSINIKGLPFNIFTTHIYLAFQTKTCCHSRGGYTMLPRPGLCDDSRFTHMFGQQCVSNTAVYLVSSCVVQILPLEKNLRASHFRT